MSQTDRISAGMTPSGGVQFGFEPPARLNTDVDRWNRFIEAVKAGQYDVPMMRQKYQEAWDAVLTMWDDTEDTAAAGGS